MAVALELLGIVVVFVCVLMLARMVWGMFK